MKMTRICLWSSPRNVSTAFMYSWGNRPDTTVLDEPLYGYYLQHTGIVHPGRDEIMNTMDCNAQSVIDHVFLGEYNTPVAFFKHMSHHTVDIPLDFMGEMHNLFFIRNPKQIIASYAQVIAEPTLADIGMAQQVELFKYAQEKGYATTVLDSSSLLANPKGVLMALCQRIGIPFYEEMLSWKPGAREADGVWAKYWYGNVHSSTGFEAPPTSERVLPDHLYPLYAQAKPYYDELMEHELFAR